MDKRMLLGLAIALILALGIGRCVHRRASIASPVPRELNQVIGEELARATAELMGESGNLLLISTERSPYEAQNLGVQIDSFRKALPRGIEIAGQRLVNPPADPDNMEVLPAEDLRAILQEADGIDAVVSMVGMPAGGTMDWYRVSDPPLIVCAYTLFPVTPDIAQGLAEADLALVPTDEAVGTVPADETPEERFQRLYTFRRGGA